MRMFVPWHTPHTTVVDDSPPASPKKAASPKAAPPPPRVHWEIFRLFNWITSVTFMFCVAHLAGVQRSGLSILFHSKAVVLVCCLCLVSLTHSWAVGCRAPVRLPCLASAPC
jgi:hypothetical protein